MPIKNHTRPTSFALFLTGLLCLSSAYAQQPTRLQVFVTGDKSKAESIVDQLNGLGAGPGNIVESDGLYKVQTKTYSSLADANFAKQKIAGRGFSDAFAVADITAQPKQKNESRSALDVKIPSIASLVAFDEQSFDITVVKPRHKATGITRELSSLDEKSAAESDLYAKSINYKGDPSNAKDAIATLDTFVRRFPDSPHASEAKLRRGYWFLVAGDKAASIEAFQQVVRNEPTSTEAGEATLRLGYFSIKMGDYGTALRQFSAVATGEVPSTPDVQLEAMLRCAALYHKGKDRHSASQWYNAIAKNADDPTIRTFAEMQIAGLTLELAWNGEGSFAEARQKCDNLLASNPDAPKSIRATAAIMALETLAYEKDFQGIVQRESATIDMLDGTAEAPLGYYWLAKAHLETSDAQGAAQILETVIDANYNTGKRFAGIDVSVQARQLAAESYRQLGDDVKAQAILRSGIESEK